MKKLRVIFGAVIIISLIYTISGCQKLVYHTVNKPTYLRVFNDLNYTITLNNKDAPLPFLTMLIDPAFNASGGITGAATMGDFLDQRAQYAPAYPAHAGNTGFRNPEYPGQQNVLVGPILNGIDLSSWAQIPSGKHRIMFISRPITSIPFLSLDPATRSTKDKVLVDTTINLGEGEVYTMEVLNPDATSNAATLYLRDEQFTKTAFSDSSVYVNFYNLSAKGYWQNNLHTQIDGGNPHPLIKDTMNVYLSLDSAVQKGDNIDGNPDPVNDPALPGYNGLYFGTVYRSTDGKVAPYSSFPLFAQLRTNHITTNIYERIEFWAPGIDNNRDGNPIYNGGGDPFPNFLGFTCSGVLADGGNVGNAFGPTLPNLIETTASGQFNPRSFGTINTVEVINGYVYLMAIQRKYAPPVIH